MKPASFKAPSSLFDTSQDCADEENDGNVPVFDPRNINISFNGCGFLGIYHVGVAAALRAYVPNMRVSSVCGASAGAIAATCLLGDVPCEKFAHELMVAASECRKLIGGPINPRFKVCNRLEDSMMRLLPDDIHKTANGKLFVSVTSVYTGENIIISNYNSKKELVESVIASTFIPIFSGIFPSRVRGVPVIDGGFSVNQVVVNSDTITVSPLAGDAHICPVDDLVSKTDVARLYVARAGTNISWENMRRLTQVLYPPQTKVLSDLMMQGFLDCTRFLCNFGVIDRSLSCLTVESHLHQAPEKQKPSAYEGSSYPETLKKVVTNFLEGEVLGEGSKQEGGRTSSAQGMLGKISSLVWNIMYYHPMFVLGRWSFRAANFMLKTLINGLAGVLPHLTEENDQYLKFKVERFLGLLVGYFGPIVGYEFELIEKPSGAARNRGRLVGPPVNVQAGDPTVDQKTRQAKFNCDVHIHQFVKGDRETANKQRRMSMFQRRKSVSVDQLLESSPAPSQARQPPGRRFSIAPHIEGSFRFNNASPMRSSIAESEEDEEEEDVSGGVSDDDGTEILSLQVESFVDAPVHLHMPCSTEEALRMQVDNLEDASNSRDVSRRVSRRGSLLPSSIYSSGRQTPAEVPKSRRGSVGASSMHSHAAGSENSNKTFDDDPQDGPSATLQNIVRMTKDRDSVFKTFYTDENGELVTVSMFDVDDPATLIGPDLLEADELPCSSGGAEDFSDDIMARLDRLHQLYGDDGDEMEEEEGEVRGNNAEKSSPL